MILSKIKDFLKEEDGLTALEYAIAGGVVTTGLVLSLSNIGDDAGTLMGNLETAVDTATQ